MLVAVLIAAYQGTKASERITPATSKVYERMLADLDYTAADAAMERLIATSMFLPTVAEIREATLAIRTGEVRPGGDAWGEVTRAIKRYGYVRCPGEDFQFSDQLTAATVRAHSFDVSTSSAATTSRVDVRASDDPGQIENRAPRVPW